MANKRELKKKINEICGILYEQCSACKHLGTDIQLTEIDGIVKSVLFLQNEVLTMCNKAPRRNAHSYFKKHLQDFKVRVLELSDQLDTL